MNPADAPAFSGSDTPVLSIGYGNVRTAAALCELLLRHGARTLVDVRSVPFSRRRREFSRGPLAAACQRAGLSYAWEGERLGGRPTDPSCLTDGEPDYGKIGSKTWFIEGIESLRARRDAGEHPAVMCAELLPERCHRAWLVAAALESRGVPVLHIDADGSLVPHRTVMDRATRGQRALFVTFGPDSPGVRPQAG